MTEADRAYHREYSRGWRKRNVGRLAAANRRVDQARGMFLARYKLAAGCFDCGYNANAVALDFDHLQPSEKSFCLSSNRKTSPRKLRTELEKCVVRCANCHRIKTHTK